MTGECGSRRCERDDEAGFAMIAAVIISVVGVLLMTTMLAQAVHLQDSTARDRQRVTALHVAEAGLDRAVVELNQNINYAGTGSAEAIPGGEYVNQVVKCTAAITPHASCPGANHYVIESQGTVGENKTADKRVRMVLGPTPVFKYALFSDDTMDIKNNSTIRGDVFANNAINLQNNSTVYGSVLSSQGGIQLENGARALKKPDGTGGDVRSGGLYSGTNGIVMGGNEIAGDAVAGRQASVCQDASRTKANISNSATIRGNAYADGPNITGGSVLGTKFPNNCQTAEAVRHVPVFTPGTNTSSLATLYGILPPTAPNVCTTPTTRLCSFDTIAAFHTYKNANKSDMQGYFVVTDPSNVAVMNVSDMTIRQTFVLVTTELMDFDSGLTYVTTAPDSTFANIISLNPNLYVGSKKCENDNSPTQRMAVDIKNGLDVVTPGAAALIYSLGEVCLKNNATDSGAVYAGQLSVKNNLDMTYNEGVERSLGFGSDFYQRESFQEIPPL